MKKIRIIPSLLIKDGNLVKGTKFKDHKYVGDIFNAVKLFSNFKVHELLLIDISATNKGQSFSADILKKISSEIFVPITVGGGINNINTALDLVHSGAEKIYINNSVRKNKNLINNLSKELGSQSVVVGIDVKKINSEYKIFYNNGNEISDDNLLDYIKILENNGSGEIVINCIDRDGLRNGFDIDLAKSLQNKVNIPIVLSCGASSIDDFENLFDNTTLNAAAAGSMFVYFKKSSSVLINYPDSQILERLMEKYE